MGRRATSTDSVPRDLNGTTTMRPVVRPRTRAPRTRTASRAIRHGSASGRTSQRGRRRKCTRPARPAASAAGPATSRQAPPATGASGRGVSAGAGPADGPATHVVARDADTLVYLANQAAISLHAWLCRADRLDRPDRVMFDLDPGADTKPADVRRAAREVGELLRELGLEPFA